ncbi:hypothetical protein VNO77_32704 [Canavalia gladiata]|uniref:Uncharacterized protein n=1 Tax=Canavalia gladiata TaxID=3824 RepID=A0AAN9KQ49_CANGL
MKKELGVQVAVGMWQSATVTIKYVKHPHKHAFVYTASMCALVIAFAKHHLPKDFYIGTVHMNHINLTGISGQ